jgi:hypothetical protein
VSKKAELDSDLFVAGFQFCEEFLLLQLIFSFIFSLVAKIALIHFETPEIAKMLHNVYKGSWIGKYPLRKPFTVQSVAKKRDAKTA